MKIAIKNLKALVWRLKWLDQINTYQGALEHIPNVKLKHFATEAMSLDAARMKELEPHKRYTLAAALITTQLARTLDDLASMFIRRMQNIHVKASEALDKYREEYQARTDRLITTLRDVVEAYSTDGEIKESRYFEMCVFSQVMWELKSGDLYIENSDAFADYRTQQISWAEYEANINDFGKLVDLPTEPKAFVAHVKNWLWEITQKTDQSFPNCKGLKL